MNTLRLLLAGALVLALSAATARAADSLDELLDQGLSAGGDPARRCQIYDEAMQTIMRNATYYPTHQSRRLNAARAEVYGIRMDVRGGYPWLYDAFIKK